MLRVGYQTYAGNRYQGLNQDRLLSHHVKKLNKTSKEANNIWLWGVFDGHNCLGELAAAACCDSFQKTFNNMIEADRKFDNKGIEGLFERATDNRQLYATPLSLSSTTKAGMRRCWRMPVILGIKDTHMTTGTVKFFNADKGYGFIAPNDGGQDAFVHISAVERAGMSTLQKDQSVSYELETDQRGKTSAVNLQAA
jgi:CspA family cold shock protein